MLVSREWHRTDVRLCRAHGAEASLYFLLLTLVFGWWGMISFFANWVAVAADIIALTTGVVQRRPEGRPVFDDSFRTWHKTARFLGNVSQYLASNNGSSVD
jgi:hypothetical protein